MTERKPVAEERVDLSPSSQELTMDDDLERMSRKSLISEIKRLRNGIRAHRDSTLHDLCWHHPELWGLLPEKADPALLVPAWPQFMQGCVKYRQSLDEQVPTAPRSSEPYNK
jgi:hypothetical protein